MKRAYLAHFSPYLKHRIEWIAWKLKLKIWMKIASNEEVNNIDGLVLEHAVHKSSEEKFTKDDLLVSFLWGQCTIICRKIQDLHSANISSCLWHQGFSCWIKLMLLNNNVIKKYLEVFAVSHSTAQSMSQDSGQNRGRFHFVRSQPVTLRSDQNNLHHSFLEIYIENYDSISDSDHYDNNHCEYQYFRS